MTEKKRRIKESGVSTKTNMLNQLEAFDGNSKVPVEVLHTVSLGVVKYLTKKYIQDLTDEQRASLQTKISHLDSGFGVSPGITKYCGSFLGRDFKAWVQVAPFVLHEFVGDEDLELLVTLAEVAKIAYAPIVSKEYLPTIGETLQHFVLLAAQFHEGELTPKPKVHYLLHLDTNIEDLGPATGFCTEKCESWNGLVRLANIYSNHQAPSRDICQCFSDYQNIKYILMGGCWGGLGEYTAGSDILTLAEDPKLKRFLFCEKENDKDIYQAGALRKGVTTANSNSLKRVVIADSDVSDMHDWELALKTWEPNVVHHRLAAQSLIDPRFGYKCHEYRAVMSSDCKLVNKGDSFSYVTDGVVKYAKSITGLKISCNSDEMGIDDFDWILCNAYTQDRDHPLPVRKFRCPTYTKAMKSILIPSRLIQSKQFFAPVPDHNNLFF